MAARGRASQPSVADFVDVEQGDDLGASPASRPRSAARLAGHSRVGSLRFANLCAAVAKNIASRPEASITFGLANALYEADAQKVSNYTAMQSGALFNVSSANRASGLGTYVVIVNYG